MRTTSASAWAAALLVLALAGCSDGSAGEDGIEGGDRDEQGADLLRIHPPEWQVGDSWTLASPQQDSGPFTHVVAGETGEDWVMDTDSRDIAYFDARFDISFLGTVRKADLAGSQGSTRVEFLRFPLAKGLNWTTPWDGAAKTVHVRDVADGRATLEARHANGTLYAAYTYDSRPGYFTRFAFYAPDGATVGFEWSLQSTGPFSGNLVRWQMDELFAHTGPIPQGQSGTFNVDPGFTDVFIDYSLDCIDGAVMLAAGPPQGPAEDRGFSQVGPCPLASADAYSVAAPEQAEQWGTLLASSPPVTHGTLDLHIFGRTAIEFPPGQPPA